MKFFTLKLAPEYRLLCAAVSQEPPADFLSQYELVGDDTLWRMAKQNRVESIVAHMLIRRLGPERTPTRWHEAHEQTKRTIGDYLDEIVALGARLAQKQISIIALKNGGLALAVESCAGCVPMGDLDLLIQRKDFPAAHEILLNNGYTFTYRNPLLTAELSTAEQEGGAEYCKLLPTGDKFWLELGWRSISGKWLSEDNEPDMASLFSRSASAPSTAVRVLNPTDNLLQVALHTAKHSFVRAPGFRLHLDVDRISRHCSIDWTLFVKNVKSLSVRTPVYFSLLIPKLLFNTPIPENVLIALRPGAVKTQAIFSRLIAAGLFNPDARKFTRLGYLIFTALLYDTWTQLWQAVFRASPAGFWPGLKFIVRLAFRRLKT